MIEAHPSTDPDRTGPPHRSAPLAILLTLAGGLALALHFHGASWWYGPLAVGGLVLAHVAVFGGIAFLLTRRRRSLQASEPEVGALLHRPRHFDWLVRVITLGREKRLRQWMLDLGGVQPGCAILDVGCGTGSLLLGAAGRVGPAGSLHGVEPSPEMAAHARGKASAAGIPVSVVEGSAGSLPYPAASFDVAFSTLVFHHLPGAMREGAVREMRRVLRPGGRAVIVDWQPPTSLLKAMTSPLFVVGLLHNLRPGGAPLDSSGTESVMSELGFESMERHSFDGGGVIGAVVGRLGPGAGPGDPVKPRGLET
ncbi:MAG: methyltransferase domain-containing protein [Planctomycetes bacterium]|nr:methyltransferase domain-containing protein [Planctomycetota bacterium]